MKKKVFNLKELYYFKIIFLILIVFFTPSDRPNLSSWRAMGNETFYWDGLIIYYRNTKNSFLTARLPTTAQISSKFPSKKVHCSFGRFHFFPLFNPISPKGRQKVATLISTEENFHFISRDRTSIKFFLIDNQTRFSSPPAFLLERVSFYLKLTMQKKT